MSWHQSEARPTLHEKSFGRIKIPAQLISLDLENVSTRLGREEMWQLETIRFFRPKMNGPIFCPGPKTLARILFKTSFATNLIFFGKKLREIFVGSKKITSSNFCQKIISPIFSVLKWKQISNSKSLLTKVCLVFITAAKFTIWIWKAWPCSCHLGTKSEARIVSCR